MVYDYISTVTKKVTTQRPTITLKKTDSFYKYVKEHDMVQSISSRIEKFNADAASGALDVGESVAKALKSSRSVTTSTTGQTRGGHYTE